VRLTCKEKVERDARGKEHPSGVVKWYEEIFDQDGELVAMATILTLVAKKSPFIDFTKSEIEAKLNALTESTKPEWGRMTAQHLVEHFEYFNRLGLGDVKGEILTPDDKIEKYQDSLWNHYPMPKNFEHPNFKKGELEELRFENMNEAKEAYWKSYEEVQNFYKENPDGKLMNPVFGMLDKYHFKLLNNKHMHHHFTQFGLI